MTCKHITSRLSQRFVFWPATAEWCRAFGGPRVTRGIVSAESGISDIILLAYEAARLQRYEEGL
jgi:hypothetical protein